MRKFGSKLRVSDHDFGRRRKVRPMHLMKLVQDVVTQVVADGQGAANVFAPQGAIAVDAVT
jgi:hypothetical protein